MILIKLENTLASDKYFSSDKIKFKNKNFHLKFMTKSHKFYLLKFETKSKARLFTSALY